MQNKFFISLIFCLSMTILFPTLATANQAEEFNTLCKSTLKVPDALCDCMSETAKNSLNEQEQEFLVATLSKDAQKIAALRQSMDHESLTKAGLLMANASNDCAKSMPSMQ